MNTFYIINVIQYMTMCSMKGVARSVKPTEITHLCSSPQCNGAFYPLLADCFGFPAHKFHSQQPSFQQLQTTIFSKKSSDKPHCTSPDQHL